MLRRLMILIAPLVAAAALSPAPVAAQDSNPTVQNQTNMQRTRDQTPTAAAQAYYNYALQLLRMGYTGPIPAGVTEESLKAAIERLQHVTQPPADCPTCCIKKKCEVINSTSAANIRGCASVYWNGSRWICQ